MRFHLVSLNINDCSKLTQIFELDSANNVHACRIENIMQQIGAKSGQQPFNGSIF